ncbi:MAG: MerR family transcriptional regulator, repressor of the yfmOP operon [Solirubrobacteraceae bacterium]|jgi:DNA-binding transcriptional MerR regulator|nr:MerR family transcriptional regulator, repressor of the yfmOP operon [Solirubrobacteraceae bacterium]
MMSNVVPTSEVASDEGVILSPPGLRIGDLARRAGTTPRTIRYYEELGLLPSAVERDAGRHRSYSEEDVQRLEQLLRLKDLLGLTLDELRGVVEAEDARNALRQEFRHGAPSRERREQILDEALEHIGYQLGLVQRRRDKLDALQAELEERRELVHRRLRELDLG